MPQPPAQFYYTHMFQNGTCALSFQFSTLVDVGEVLCYRRSFSAEQVSNLLLCQPYRLFFKPNIQPHGFVRLIDDYLILAHCPIPSIVPAHCATERRSQGTIRLRRIFGIGDASPNADDAWAAHSRSSPRRKPPPHVPNRRPRFPTSTPPPGPSAHPSGFSIRSQQDSALAFGSAIPSAFRPRPSKQSFSAATLRFQPNGFQGSRSYLRRHGVQFRRAQI